MYYLCLKHGQAIKIALGGIVNNLLYYLLCHLYLAHRPLYWPRPHQRGEGHVHICTPLLADGTLVRPRNSVWGLQHRYVCVYVWGGGSDNE